MSKISRFGLCVALVLSAKVAIATPVLPSTTGLVAWFDASNPNGTPNGTTPNQGVNPLNGAPVATWNNLAPTAQNQGLAAVVTHVGTAHDAVTYTAPTFVTGSAPSGLPTVQFNGTSDSLQNAFTTAVTQPTYTFIVWKTNDNGIGAAQQIVSDGTATARQAIQYDTPGDSVTAGPHNALFVYAGNVALASSNFLFTSVIVENVVANSTSSTLTANTLAGQIASAGPADAGSQGLSGITLGSRFAEVVPNNSSFVLNGYIAEELIFTSAPDTAAVISYLEAKWLVVPAPEPSSVILAALGLCGLVAGGLRARARRKS